MPERYQGMTPAGVALDQWRHAHCLGRFKIHPKKLSPPNTRFASRDADPEHIKQLKESFRRVATVNQDLVGVIIDTAMHTRLQRAGALGTSDDYTLRSDLDTALYGDGPVGTPDIFIASGNHTRIALTQLLQEFSCNVKYQLAYVYVLVVPDDEQAERFLTLYGNIENMKPRRKPDFREWIMGMHERALSHRLPDGSWNSSYTAAMKEDMMFATKQNKGSIGHYWQLARRRGESWDLLVKLFNGQFTKNPVTRINNKAPTSAANFTKLGNLPEDVVVELLTAVRENEITWAALQHKILQYKMGVRIRIEGAMHLSGMGVAPVPDYMQGSAFKRLDATETAAAWQRQWYENVVSRAPSLNAEWVDKWAQSLYTMRMKEPMPEGWKLQLETKFRSDTSKAQRRSRRPQGSQVLLPCAPVTPYIHLPCTVAPS